MTLLGRWNGDTAWTIRRVGETKDEGGDGTRWWCSCPHGRPTGHRVTDKESGYPCKHLRSVWSYAEQGLFSPHVDWEPEGIEAGKNCRCRGGEPCALVFGPPLERPPVVEGPARNKPCPCGSGVKYKKCEGIGPGRPEGPPHPLLHPDEIVEAIPAPPKPIDEKARLKAERAQKRAEKKEAERKRIDEIRERILAEERERAAERAFEARSKKARAVIEAAQAPLRQRAIELGRSGDASDPEYRKALAALQALEYQPPPPTPEKVAATRASVAAILKRPKKAAKPRRKK